MTMRQGGAGRASPSDQSPVDLMGGLQGDFDPLIAQFPEPGMTSFDRLTDVGFDLLHGLALGCAAGY